jgi:mRNA interferase MazF
MKRGDIWTLQDDGYASKARPVLVVQGDSIDSFDSMVLCLLTSFESDHIRTRVRIDPTEENGLQKVSYVMTEKLVTVRADELGMRIGVLTREQMWEVSVQLASILEISAEDLAH